MIEYKGQLNMGNEAFGSERTITANESVRTCDTKALAREISHASHDLIPEQVANMVLENFCKAAVEKMSEGFAIQLNTGDLCAIRIFPDVHIVGGNINLSRAKELDPTITELTAENAGELIDKAGGVKVRVRATCMQPFTDLLEKEYYQVKRVGIETKAYVAKKNDEDDGEGGTNENENQNQGGDNNQGGGELEP